MRKSKPFKRLRLAKLPLVVAAVLLVVGGAIAYGRLSGNNDKAAPQSASSDADANDNPLINLNPATQEEKNETEAHKQALSQKPTPTPSPTPPTGGSKSQVYPIITSANHSEVNAYVSGVTEDGGTCTATATKGSQVITKSVTGFINVSYTSCPPIQLSLPAGAWSVVVSYSSATSEGKSQEYKVN